MPIVSRSQWVADQLERRYWGFYKMNFRRINWNSNNILPLREKNGCNYVRSYSTSNKNRAGIFWKSPSVSQEKKTEYSENHVLTWAEKVAILPATPNNETNRLCWGLRRGQVICLIFLKMKMNPAWVRTINRLLVVERRSQEQGDIS